MCIVMEGYILAVTGIDSGSTHTGAPRITCDIFHEFLKTVVAPEIFWSGLSADSEAIRIF